MTDGARAKEARRVVLITAPADIVDGRPQYGPQLSDTVAGLEALGWRVELGAIDDRTSVAGVLRNVVRLRQLMRHVQPGVVHAYYGSVTAAIARMIKGECPLVVTFRGDDLLGTPLPGWGWRMRERTARGLGLWAAHGASVLAPVAENLRAELPARLRARATVLPHGVDPAVYRPVDRAEARARLGIGTSEPIVVFNAGSGDNSHVKNLPLAERVMEVVHRDLPGARLLRLSSASREEVALSLNAGDALLVTSLHEGSPNIVKEAMACALPVIAVPCGDVQERLAGAEPGAICPYEADALAAALVPILTTRRRSNGPALIHAQSLTVADQVARLCQLYESSMDQA